MKELGWKRYLAGTGLQESEWKNASYPDKRGRRGKARAPQPCIAYGWGRAVKDMPGGRYFDVDCATTRLGLDLAAGIGRSEAAALVILNAPLVLEAIARADHEAEPVFFCVAQGMNGGGEHYTCAVAPLSKFADITVGENEAPTRMIFVNMKRILATVRANAAAGDIDLSDPFLPPVDDPLFKELAKVGKEFSDDLLARVHIKLSGALAGTEARH